MSEKFQPVEVKFGEDVEKDITAYVHEQLEALEEAYRDLHNNKLPRYRKLYLGIPAEMSRNFPFPNAANTIVQVIGETVDAMVARVMGLIYATHPLWVFKNYAKAKENEEKKLNENRRSVIEDFMDLAGFEPNALNLSEIESLWFTDASKLGTSYIKIGLEHNEEAVVVGYSEAKIKGKSQTIYSGPTVTNLRHEDVLAWPDAPSLEKSEFVAIRRTLRRADLEERKFKHQYDEAAVASIMGSADRSTTNTQVKQELQAQGVVTPTRPNSTGEWDIWECHFAWWAGNPKRKFRLIYSYHKKSRTVMRKVFNFMPNNELPIKRAKLGYRTDGLLGHGYAELLETYQEELSTTHNQRLDNATVANVRALRVSPNARALDANMELFPSAILVGNSGDVESIQVGDVYPSTFKNEEMTLALVARRSGITPAVAGSGTGGLVRPGGKGQQQYSAAGTLAVMQENNTVVGFATAEFRAAHVGLGATLARMYGKFGTGGLEDAFGLDESVLKEALEEFTEGRMRLPIRAATGSLNKEADKQAGMILAGVLQRHYTATSQVLQALSNPMVPPIAKEYFTNLIAADTMFHRKIVKDFGYEQPDLYVPEANTGDAKGAAQAGGQAGQVASPGQPVGGAVPNPQAGAGTPVPRGDVGGGGAGTPPTPVPSAGGR